MGLEYIGEAHLGLLRAPRRSFQLGKDVVNVVQYTVMHTGAKNVLNLDIW